MPNDHNSFARRGRRLAEQHPLTTIALILLLTLGPFLNKAVHIDDPLFVWTAEQILKHPGDFYGFCVNWYGSTDPMATVNCNPPGIAYFLAGVMALFGGREMFLHAGMLLITFAAATGIFQLAKLWCERPLTATFIAMSTPVFLVSATTLMCDVPMLAAWIWSVVFWERALKGGSAGNYVCAGLLAGLTVLTKYSGLTLLPLLPILGVLRKKNPGAWLCWLVVPAAMIGFYQWGTARLYGHGLISAAASYASQTRFDVTGGWQLKLILGLAYCGGCLLPVLIFVHRLWSRREWMLGGGSFLAATSLITFAGGIGPQFGPLFQLQMALFLAAGIHLLLLAVAELWQRRDTISCVLALWIAGGFLFAGVLNWTVSARSFLPLAPAAAILVVRRMTPKSRVPENAQPVVWLLVFSASISLLIATADFFLADSGRAAARQIAAKYTPTANKLWFEGHGGFQYYLQQSGALPVDFSASVLAPGEMLVLPSNNSNLVSPDAGEVENVAVLEFAGCPALSTVHAATGAGFYGAGGWLPFVFGPAPVERYFVYRSAQTLCFAPPETLNNLAWEVAVSPGRRLREGRGAVELARRACEQTHFEKAVYVGTLAAAYAAAQEFDQAIATAQRACDLAAKHGETDLLKRNQELLELYRAHKPATE